MAVDEATFRSMASDVQVVVVDGPPQACAAAQRALGQLERCWSRFSESSDISRLNHHTGRSVCVDPSTLTLVEVLIDAWRITDMRFDPTTLPALVEAGYVASIEDPAARTVIPFADADLGPGPSPARIEVDRASQSITLPVGMALDAGGIGKGLAADLVVAELLSRGAGGVLVSIGGDLAAAGTAPNLDGWQLDIEDPMNPPVTIARLAFSEGGVATSSTLSRRWDNAGTQQHHVIDPSTGAPSATDLGAVTVFASSGWQAEAHATALLLGGSKGFEAFAHERQIEAIATTMKGQTMTTEGLAPYLPLRVMR
jgi:thiamine biosynthesis lipoprotein